MTLFQLGVHPTVPPQITALQGCDNLQNMAATTSAPLPKIYIFITQRCSIPLLRCDFDSALKAANSHNKEMHETTGNTLPENKLPEEDQSDEIQKVRTSSRPRTVINYKQFLEEYADAPLPRLGRNVKLI